MLGLLTSARASTFWLPPLSPNSVIGIAWSSGFLDFSCQRDAPFAFNSRIQNAGFALNWGLYHSDFCRPCKTPFRQTSSKNWTVELTLHLWS